jgi:hypothetical protein
VCIAIGIVSLYSLWYCTAYPRGMLAAHIDHERGRHEVQVIGYPCPWESEYDSLLRSRYGVELRTVAGCVVSEDLCWYVSGYNSVSRRLANERYGKDIFAECAADAEALWIAQHPEQMEKRAAP